VDVFKFWPFHGWIACSEQPAFNNKQQLLICKQTNALLLFPLVFYLISKGGKSITDNMLKVKTEKSIMTPTLHTNVSEGWWVFVNKPTLYCSFY